VKYEKMLLKYYADFPRINPIELKRILKANENLILLDVRESNEYNVSHLPNALHFGYETQNWLLLDNLPKDTPIIVYCSIGARSQVVEEELLKKGFSNVRNLHGGIFLWSNSDFLLIDSNGHPTSKIHGYDQTWGKWIIDKDKIVYE
jgi:rhodanese-related sulfurtransferase